MCKGHERDLHRADPKALSATAPTDWLDAAAARRPYAVALSTPAGDLTYAQLDAAATTAARRLAARGARPGARVAIALPAGAAFAVALHGCLRLGAVAVPVDLRLAETERSARTAGASVVVDEPLDGPEHDFVARESHDPAAIAVVVHTSGTTGVARPVELTYGNWEASARGSAARLGLDPGERWLCALPLSHVGGLSILVRSAICATTAIVQERFDAGAIAKALSGGAATLVSLVPTMLARILETAITPAPTLRCALMGGGPLPPDLARRAAEAGFPLAQTYGLTEACSQVTTSEIGDAATAGRPLDETRLEIEPDGEILVAGPTVAPGSIAPDGWLHTGDLGRLDENGRLLLTGRRSEIVISGGENVAPAEVEAVLESHPDVAEAAVHGRPDPEWGEAVVATVVLEPGGEPTPQDLQGHCRKRLAAFKVPKEIAFATELPRTASGKLRRDRLV